MPSNSIFSRPDDRSRRDSRRLRTLSPVYRLTPFIMRSPSDAENSFTDTTDLTAAEAWLEAKRNDGLPGISLVHLFIAAYVRTVALRPALNRYISGRYFYARNHVDVILSTGRGGAAESGAMTVKIRLLPSDTVYDVYHKITERVGSFKADETAGQLEQVAGTLVRTPRFLLRFAAWIVRIFDFTGWLRAGITDRSPFHGSVVVSDEGAVSLPSIARNLGSFGNVPVSISIGRRKNAVDVLREGAVYRHRTADYTVTIDSRIADSAYYGAAFKYFRYYLTNPADLELPPERVNADVL